MEFQIVGHACLAVEAAGKRLLVDPWLAGPVYWGSWWHCPDPVWDEGWLAPDFCFLTHWHFDHFHRESLERLDRACHMLVPRFPISHMARDLRELGFERVAEIPHARPHSLADGFRLTPYQVQYEDDCALAIEADGALILDLNDSKPLPGLWRLLRRRHPRVDFMLRSHSPAWSYPHRFQFEDPGEAIAVDRESYLRAFRSAALQLRPRFAVPFASSVCHLHREVASENAHRVGPRELEAFLALHPVEGTRLVRMPHGSRWSSERGFQGLEDGGDPDAGAWLARRLETSRAELEALYAREAAARVGFEEFERFFRRFLRRAFWLRPFLGARWLFAVAEGGQTHFWRVDFRRGRIERLAGASDDYTSRIEISAAVLGDALRRGLFKNIDISKRWRVAVRRGGVLPHLLLQELLSIHDAGVLDLRNLLRPRFLAGWWRRRSELRDYARMAFALLGRGSAAAARSVTDPD